MPSTLLSGSPLLHLLLKLFQHLMVLVEVLLLAEASFDPESLVLSELTDCKRKVSRKSTLDFSEVSMSRKSTLDFSSTRISSSLDINIFSSSSSVTSFFTSTSLMSMEGSLMSSRGCCTAVIISDLISTTSSSSSSSSSLSLCSLKSSTSLTMRGAFSSFTSSTTMSKSTGGTGEEVAPGDLISKSRETRGGLFNAETGGGVIARSSSSSSCSRLPISFLYAACLLLTPLSLAEAGENPATTLPPSSPELPPVSRL